MLARVWEPHCCVILLTDGAASTQAVASVCWQCVRVVWCAGSVGVLFVARYGGNVDVFFIARCVGNVGVFVTMSIFVISLGKILI